MMHNALQETLFFYKFFLKTHQQNLNFSPYYRGVFFYGEMKCKQDVKNFEKHPNKIEIFLRIVEGLFSWVNFLFSNLLMLFSFWKSISRIIRKEAAQWKKATKVLMSYRWCYRCRRLQRCLEYLARGRTSLSMKKVFQK